MLDFSRELSQQDVMLAPKRSMSYADAIEDFRRDAESYGLILQSIDTSGNIVRCTTQSKPTKRNGWYCFEELHPGYFVAKYGDWRESDGGVSWRSWTEGGVSDEERAMLKAKSAQREKQRKEQSKLEQLEKAEKINAHFQSLPPCQKHSYATNKHIGLFGDVRVDDKGALTIPLIWTDGTIIGMQKIYPDGDKRTHGVIDRTEVRPFAQILGESDKIYIVEGYSTAASVHEATGKTVIIALYANRLKIIAEIVKSKAGKTPITIVADNDTHLTPNKGVNAAREAADAIGADVVIPEIGDESVDSNDIHCQYGLEMLKTMLSVDGKSIYGVTTLKSICERDYPHNPVIEGLLDEGECLILVGDSNLGKSIMTLHIAAMCGNPDLDNPAWGNGKIDFNGPPMLFGHFPILSMSRSMFLQDENSGKSIQKRIRLMTEKNEILRKGIDSENILTLTKGEDGNPCANGSLDDPVLFRSLKINILKEKIRLLIVDPLSSYHGAADENANVEMLKALNNTFGRLAEETNCAIILIHHAGKGGVENGARGASSIKGWSDSMVVGEEIENDDDGKVIKMYYVKSRNFERRPAEFYLRMDNNLEFHLLEDYEPPSESKEKKHADTSDVLAVLNLNGEMTGKAKLIEAVANHSGASKASAKYALDKAVQSELIRKHEPDGPMKGVRYTV